MSLLLILFLLSDTYTSTLGDFCGLRETCSSCIQTLDCVWCASPTWDETRKRCISSSSDNSLCGEAYIMNPKSSQEFVQNSNLVSHGSSSSQVVQIAPQYIRVKLRPNEAYNLTLQYARADYAVDLYFLMDLSNSMKDDKDKLSSLGSKLVETMQSFTSDFQVGFGSFVDKVAMPYVDMIPERLQKPCKGCISPYGFRNHMKLSKNIYNFSHEVARAVVSGNMDTPEGGFDALMQAVVCHDQIGWRQKSRKLLVFSTDSSFHMAGDGKLAGITEPNDGECHLDENGFYTHSTLQDYPSISFLNHKVQENAVNIIFAVTEPQLEMYTHLRDSIGGSKTGTLSADSSNIVELLEHQYKEILSSVEMKDDAPSYIQVSYFTSCTNSSGPLKKINKCDGLLLGQEVSFLLEIKVPQLPLNRTLWNTSFLVFPVGIKESLRIDVEILGECLCETNGHPLYVEKAKQCSYNGTYMCGICECDAAHFGQKCECSARQLTGSRDALGCSADNKTDCSGRGTCLCGVCKCDIRENEDEVIYGKFCECDNFSCKQRDGKLCAGHGVCECGQCKCEEGWSDGDCACSTAISNCMDSEEDTICSGHGECQCGQCVCDKGYLGRFCERNEMDLLRAECEAQQNCILTQVHKQVAPAEEPNISCSQNIHIVEKLEEGIIVVGRDSNGCLFEYACKYNELNDFLIEAVGTLNCPLRISSAVIISSGIGAVLIVGILTLLLWKWITATRDYFEYMRFQEDRKQLKWDAAENPLYREATTYHQNPTYSQLQ